MQSILNGIVQGSTLGLIAVAYTMIYGVAGVVNFAFGGLFMFGAYGFLVLLSAPGVVLGPFLEGLGMPLWLSIAGGLLAAVVLGFGVERVSYRLMRDRGMLPSLIASLAALFVLQGLGQLVFGPGQKAMPSVVDGPEIRFAGAIISVQDLAVVLVALSALGLTMALIHGTAFGRGVRAVAANRETAALMGIDGQQIVFVVFALGSALAGLSGIVYGSTFQFASPTMGYLPGLMGLVAAVVGGIGSIGGAFVAALAIGVIQSVVATYVSGGSAYQDVIAFAVLVLFLWIRPRGLFGQSLEARA